MVYKIAKDENLVETPKTNVKRKRSSGKENESGTKEYGENLVGLWIKVWWPEDREFYKGVICSFDPFKKKHQVNYDDGEVEYYVLKRKNGRSLKPVTLI